jgi:hypothetical protein
VFAENLRIDIRRGDVEASAEVHPKTQTVEQGPGTEDAVVARQLPCQIGEWIGRIGHHEQHGIRNCRDDLWDYIAINRRIRVEQA